MSDNLKVSRNMMPMFVWCDRKIDLRVQDSWPKAGMGSASIVCVRNDLLINLPREAERVLSSMPVRGG